MVVALGPRTWAENVGYIPPEGIEHYKILPVPTTGLQHRLQSILTHIKRSQDKDSQSSEVCIVCVV